MAAPSKKIRGETVSIKTFNSWDFHRDFSFEHDGNKITLLQCNICSEHINSIRREARYRGIGGQVLKGILAYVDGVSYVHKSNVSRHVQSGSLHDWAKKRSSKPAPSLTHPATGIDCTLPSSDISNSVSCATSDPTPVPAKNTISDIFEKTNKSLYTHHFNTALALVMKECSMSGYKDLIELQRKNGVQFVTSAKDNNKRCREFISYIALAMREDIKQILQCANVFSFQQDGTEARKTREEKELIYVKIVVRGKPVELFLKCQRMNDFGGVDAASLKKSVDEAFESYDVSGDRYIKCMVSACADGAAVNMGRKTGALTVLKVERDWLLIIHCSAHRIELAVKDAFQGIKNFEKVDEMMLGLYTFFKNSGKCWRILLLVAERLNVIVSKLPKSSGTRFQVHKYRAIKAMIINFVPLCLFAENLIQADNKTSKPDQKAKLKGYLKQWLDYGYLAGIHLYRITLQQTAHLSYVAQHSTPLVTTLINAVKSTVDELKSIQSTNNGDLPFACTTNDDDSVTIHAEATNLPSSIRFKDKNKLSLKQRERAEKNVNIVKESFTLKNVANGKETVHKIKTELIPSIANQLETRLESFKDPIFTAFTIADHTQWDESDSDYGKDHIRKIASHFSESLAFHKFSLDMAIYEWRGLRRLVAVKFHHFKNSINMWQQLFSHHHNEYPHILLIIEIILVTAFASATVERGISTLNRQLTSSRTSMKNTTLDDLLLLRINLPVLLCCDPHYEEKLIEKAVSLYLNDKKRRNTQTRNKPPVVSVSELQTGCHDTFLPTPASSVIRSGFPNYSQLTSTEEFLTVSDTDSSDSDGHESDTDSDVCDDVSGDDE